MMMLLKWNTCEIGPLFEANGFTLRLCAQVKLSRKGAEAQDERLFS